MAMIDDRDYASKARNRPIRNGLGGLWLMRAPS